MNFTLTNIIGIFTMTPLLKANFRTKTVVLEDAAKKLMDCSVVSRVDADEAANLKKAMKLFFHLFHFFALMPQ